MKIKIRNSLIRVCRFLDQYVGTPMTKVTEVMFWWAMAGIGLTTGALFVVCLVSVLTGNK